MSTPGHSTQDPATRRGQSRPVDAAPAHYRFVLLVGAVTALETAGSLAAAAAIFIHSTASPAVASRDLLIVALEAGVAAAAVAAAVVAGRTRFALDPLLTLLRVQLGKPLPVEQLSRIGRQVGPRVAATGMAAYSVAAAVWAALAVALGVPPLPCLAVAGFSVASGILLNAYCTVLRLDTHVMAYEYVEGCDSPPPRWNAIVRGLYLGERVARGGEVEQPWYGPLPLGTVGLAIPVAAMLVTHDSMRDPAVLWALLASVGAMLLVSVLNERVAVAVDALVQLRVLAPERWAVGASGASLAASRLLATNSGQVPRSLGLAEPLRRAIVQNLRDPLLLLRWQTTGLAAQVYRTKAAVHEIIGVGGAERRAIGAADLLYWMFQGHLQIADGRAVLDEARVSAFPGVASSLVAAIPGVALELEGFESQSHRFFPLGLQLLVLDHLLENAMQASREGDQPPTVRATASDCYVTVVVEDRGPGFSPELPFEEACGLRRTTREGAMGLGLYLVRRVVEAVGGELQQDREGSVTRVATRFPTKELRKHGTVE